MQNVIYITYVVIIPDYLNYLFCQPYTNVLTFIFSKTKIILCAQVKGLSVCDFLDGWMEGRTNERTDGRIVNKRKFSCKYEGA